MDKFAKWLIAFALFYLWYHIFMAIPSLPIWQ